MPDGKLLSLLPHSIDLWHPLKGQYLGRLVDENNLICCMALLPLNCIATGSNDRRIRMWHIDTKQLVMPLLFGHEYGIKFLAAYQESYLVSMDVFNNIVIWYIDAVEKHKVVHKGSLENIMSFVMDYSGNIFISNAEGILSKIAPCYSPNLNCSILKEDIVFDLSDSIYTLKILPDGNILAHTSELKFYYLDQNKRRILNTFEYKNSSWPHDFDILSDGRIVMSRHDGEITILTFPLRKIIPEDLFPLALALKDNHSINSIKLPIHQRNEEFLNQVYNYIDKKRAIKIIYHNTCY